MNYLLIVEGAKAEYAVFEKVFLRYGFNIIAEKQMHSFDSFVDCFDTTAFSDSRDNIVIAQGPKNRISELLRTDSMNFDFSNAFQRKFNGVFLIYDVDHTSQEDLKQMMSIHADETDSGLLLVSSPCIEILSEPGRTVPIDVDHLSTYKRERNSFVNNTLHYGKNAIDYIADNFEKLALFFLDQNYREFDEPNIMEHPHLIIDKINEKNIRTPDHVVYKYFTTVIYVVLACILGLTREIDNYGIVKSYFEKKHRDSRCKTDVDNGS